MGMAGWDWEWQAEKQGRLGMADRKGNGRLGRGMARDEREKQGEPTTKRGIERALVELGWQDRPESHCNERAPYCGPLIFKGFTRNICQKIKGPQ